ncbi:MAG: phosphoribosylaminoimidazolesuccinocarboxamide synthase [Phycisphaerales bacterium]
MHAQASSPRSRASAGVFDTDLNLPGRRRGKVRDIYRLPDFAGGESLLIVASDRISAFDVVMPTTIPGKGRLLTEVASFWLRWIEGQGLSRTHLISTEAGDVPASAFEGSKTTRGDLEGRIMIGRRCQVIPVEFVVRGYLEGSGWREYQKTSAICGVKLPSGLKQCSRLPEAIFTPATKEDEGHDENIDFERACTIAGRELMTTLRDRSLAIYNAAAEYALARGIIIADTKFEFGLPVDEHGKTTGEEPILIDEALTPDSSRFWPADEYEPGHSQRSFDKQYVREHLEGLVSRGEWDKTPPGPALPDEVVQGTLSRYAEARDRLTGN